MSGRRAGVPCRLSAAGWAGLALALCRRPPRALPLVGPCVVAVVWVLGSSCSSATRTTRTVVCSLYMIILLLILWSLALKFLGTLEVVNNSTDHTHTSTTLRCGAYR